MPRQPRESSGTGIYHVMMRGINHQNRRTSERRAKLAWAIPSEKEEDEVNIFEEQEDYYQFLNTLDMMALSYEPDGTPFGRNYILYAYCLMSNHIHLKKSVLIELKGKRALLRQLERLTGISKSMIYRMWWNRNPSRWFKVWLCSKKVVTTNDCKVFVILA